MSRPRCCGVIGLTVILIPLLVSSVSGEVAAAGASHSVLAAPDGHVWTWGANSYGQLGDGTTSQRTTPVSMPNLTGVVAVAAGQGHTLALKSDGRVWAWGQNTYGQLGDGTTTQRTSPVLVSALTDVIAIAAGDNHSVALTASGVVYTWGYNLSGQIGDGTTTQRPLPQAVTLPTAVEMAGVVGASRVVGGQYHSLIVLEASSWPATTC